MVTEITPTRLKSLRAGDIFKFGGVYEIVEDNGETLSQTA
jgi:hypothetical protein